MTDIMISMTKKYRYRNGEPARILCVDRPHRCQPVVSMDANGNLSCHHADGRHAISNYDLIEVTPYGDFKIDDKVVCYSNGESFKAHFAGVTKNGKPTSWHAGQTSFTTKLRAVYDYCEKYTDEV